MKIKTRLILSFLMVSILPLAVIGYFGLQAMDRVTSMAVDESTLALKQLGEASIHQKALDVARQVELYLKAHPELLTLSPQELEADEALAAIAVQAVGETGYTAVYNSDGIVYFHANPNLVDTDMHALADTFPAFWAIFEASLDGTIAASYYDWQDADGAIRDKYMSCVPVGDTHLRVAATTYIDEFYQPIRNTEAKITAVFRESQRYLLVALVAAGLFAAGLALWLAWGIGQPILAITDAAAAVEAEKFEPKSLETVTRRTDELGQLAQVFQRMAHEVYIRAQRLKQQVQQLRIEIDTIKQQREVSAIVETDFFQELQTKARAIRRRKDIQENKGE